MYFLVRSRVASRLRLDHEWARTAWFVAAQATTTTTTSASAVRRLAEAGVARRRLSLRVWHRQRESGSCIRHTSRRSRYRSWSSQQRQYLFPAILSHLRRQVHVAVAVALRVRINVVLHA